jgi:hypothetical protein
MRQFSDLGFFRNRRKGRAVKNLAGTLHADRVGCTLSVGREVKMEIPCCPPAYLVSGLIPNSPAVVEFRFVVVWLFSGGVVRTNRK